MIALPPGFVTVVGRGYVDLHTGVQELSSQGLGVLQGPGDLEPPALEEDLEAPDEVALRDTVGVRAGHTLGVAAGDRHGVEGEPATPEHVHHRRPYSGSIHRQRRLAL